MTLFRCFNSKINNICHNLKFNMPIYHIKKLKFIKGMQKLLQRYILIENIFSFGIDLLFLGHGFLLRLIYKFYSVNSQKHMGVDVGTVLSF